MSVWAIVIIVVTIAMVVGPVAMLRPSKRDSRLTDLRQAAAQKGIRVRLASLVLSAKSQDLAVYSLSFEKSEEVHPQWLIVQQSFTHDVHFSGQWDWAEKSAAAPRSQHDALLAFLASLDPSILGVEVTAHTVALYWQERSISIDQVESLLFKMKETFTH